jgi:hypothetical protein
LNPLYVVLLALFNDITMIPVAEDNQSASAAPQHANVSNLIGFSVMLGVMQSVVSVTFYLVIQHLGFGLERFPTSEHAQNAIWLQVSVAAELLIFAARAPGLFFLSMPSWRLLGSVILVGIIGSILLAVYAFPDQLSWREAGIIVAWDVAALFIVDIAKLIYKYTFEHNVSGIINEASIAEEDAREAQETSAHGATASTPLTSTALQHGGSTVERSAGHRSSLGSFVDFMSTGRAPYVKPGKRVATTSGSKSFGTHTSSLHKRTPAMLQQENSHYRSF